MTLHSPPPFLRERLPNEGESEGSGGGLPPVFGSGAVGPGTWASTRHAWHACWCGACSRP